MVLQAGALESLTTSAGRELDPEAGRALTRAATGIRLHGRQALADLRSMVAVLPEHRAG